MISSNSPKAPRLERGFEATDYLRAHEAMRRNSNQCEQILSWFDACDLLDFDGLVPALLSVGPGGGEIDMALIRRLDQRGRAFAYDAIDPSRTALDRFRLRCAEEHETLANRVWLYQGKFEEFEPGHSYDLIHLVHALYGLDDMAVGLSKAYRLLSDGGRVGIVCSTDEGVNRFKRSAFRKVRLPGRAGRVPDGELLDVLSELDGAEMQFEIIPSEIDITSCLEETAEGDALVSFFLQTDFSAMDEGERAAVLESLADCSEEGRGGRRVLTQPMLGVCIEKRRRKLAQRVELKMRDRVGFGSLADVAIYA